MDSEKRPKKTENKQRKQQEQRKQQKRSLLRAIVLSFLMVAAIGMIWYAVLLSAEQAPQPAPPVVSQENTADSQQAGQGTSSYAGSADSQTPSGQNPSNPQQTAETAEADVFDFTEIPPYDGSPNIPVHGNRPYFTEADYTTESFETYGELDELGRCTYAFACVGEDLMPTEKRERISEIRPSGWKFTKYEGIDGNYLYNRCHLIAYGLTAENANERNLITGTRYMNTLGMNDLENETIGYIRRTGNHVLYRVTPVFEGKNLIASGVLMEAQSVEKDDFRFCVYVYNVQPGITIDYRTGDSSGTPFAGTEVSHPSASPSPKPDWDYVPPAEDVTYILNTKSMKFHRPGCDAVPEMNPKNREDFKGTREEVLAMGYEPCGGCKP